MCDVICDNINHCASSFDTWDKEVCTINIVIKNIERKRWKSKKFLHDFTSKGWFRSGIHNGELMLEGVLT